MNHVYSHADVMLGLFMLGGFGVVAIVILFLALALEEGE